MDDRKNLIYLDLLNTLACLMVVFFHCNMIFYDYSDTISWKISVVERCIVYSAVPIFFMLTGAKLMNYRERCTTSEYAKKRLVRTGVPFLFWNLFYIVFNFVRGTLDFENPAEFISAFMNSEFQGRYWFFFPLFAIYAAIPVVSLLLKVENHRKYLWYMVAVSFGFSWFLQPALALCGISFNTYLNFPLTDGFLTFSIFGYLVSAERWKKHYRHFLYTVTGLSQIYVIVYTCLTSAHMGETNQYLVSYEYFPAALLGASIFVFFRHLDLDALKDGAVKFFRTLAGCNMGVWLTHSLCIVLVRAATGLGDDSYIFRFIMPFVIYALCAFGTWIAKKIPFVKYIV